MFPRHILSARQVFFARRSFTNRTGKMSSGRSEGGKATWQKAQHRQIRRPRLQNPLFKEMGCQEHTPRAIAPAVSARDRRLNHDAANNGRNEQKCRGKQNDVNRSLYLMPRLGGSLGTIELVHMRIRYTQIRHVLPPFVFLIYLWIKPRSGYSYISYQLGRDEFSSRTSLKKK